MWFKKVFSILIVVFLVTPGFLAAQEFAETLSYNFSDDNRGWELGYSASNEAMSLQEYVLPGETVENWSELVGVQVYFGLGVIGTLDEYIMNFKRGLLGKCPNSTFNVIEETKDSVLYEWKVEKCANIPDEHMLGRVLASKVNFYHVYYETKKTPLDSGLKKTWIGILKKVRTLHMSKAEIDEKVEIIREELKKEKAVEKIRVKQEGKKIRPGSSYSSATTVKPNIVYAGQILSGETHYYKANAKRGEDFKMYGGVCWTEEDSRRDDYSDSGTLYIDIYDENETRLNWDSHSIAGKQFMSQTIDFIPSEAWPVKADKNTFWYIIFRLEGGGRREAGILPQLDYTFRVKLDRAN